MTWKICANNDCSIHFKGLGMYCGRYCRDENTTRQARMGESQRRGFRREAEIVKERGGRTRPGSGNQRSKPGDGITDTELQQIKTTMNKSFRITKDMWNQIEDEAAMMGREPGLIIDISGLVLEVRRG